MADQIWIQFGMVGRMGLCTKRQVVVFKHQYTGKSNFGSERGAPHCNQWGVCGVDVRKCVNCRSCGLGWCVWSAKALVGVLVVQGEGKVWVFFVPDFHYWMSHWVVLREMFYFFLFIQASTTKAINSHLHAGSFVKI